MILGDVEGATPTSSNIQEPYALLGLKKSV